jgi:hypothetical protein
MQEPEAGENLRVRAAWAICQDLSQKQNKNKIRKKKHNV